MTQTGKRDRIYRERQSKSALRAAVRARSVFEADKEE